MAFDNHPRLLPDGYRIRWVFFILPCEVARRVRWCEWVGIVQRFEGPESDEVNYRAFSHNWHDVGFLDEVLPDLKPRSFADDADL